MKELRIERYDPAQPEEWNAFVATARNSTFLFDRGFMDYHADRFTDHSLTVRDTSGNLIALLPANETAGEDGTLMLHSHSGLTYGGWIVGERHPDAGEMLEIFRLLSEYCRERDIVSLDYKPVPFIYPRQPAQEDLYALFRNDAVLTQRNISVAIDLRANPGFNTQQKRNLKRGLKTDAVVVRRQEAGEFHRLLTECLAERHGVVPVHTEAELTLLMSRFPEKIMIFTIECGGEAEAGVCLFDCGHTVHAQYICSTEKGRKEGLLTRLFDELISTELFPGARYFDFGICNEDAGRWLNEGLYRQKSGLGGTAVAYDRYLLKF